MMAESLLTVLQRVQKHISELKEREAALSERCRLFEIRISDLEHELSETQKERDRARLEADYLTVSHKLADNPDTLVATRRRIAGLIRNIDRCLEMLKE
ncbi:MAG: hypothetical protein K2M87_06950 [Muribaculaceae bacterium]|nr:hypothetical protein [Muribaculaceae bacterium]